MEKAKNVIDAMTGVSLRDRFAGQALIGLLAAENAINPARCEYVYAKAAYALADAMLAAREAT